MIQIGFDSNYIEKTTMSVIKKTISSKQYQPTVLVQVFFNRYHSYVQGTPKCTSINKDYCTAFILFRRVISIPFS